MEKNHRTRRAIRPLTLALIMDSVRLCRAGLTDVLWQIFLSLEFGTKLQIFEDAQISIKHDEGWVNGSLNAKNQLNLSSCFFCYYTGL